MEIRLKKIKNVELTFDPNDNINYLEVIWQGLKNVFTVSKKRKTPTF